MAQARDYYEVLGVPRGAPDKDIRKAYKRLARKHHPDVNPGDDAAEAKFKEITEAHNVLGDAEKRKKYDQFGRAYQHAQQSGQYQDMGFEDFLRNFGGGGGAGGFGFADVFGDIFGRTARSQTGTGPGRAGAAAPRKGETIEHQLDIPFDEAVHGAQKSISLTLSDRCQTCGGVGGPTSACKACGGSGFTQQAGGFMNLSAACPQCQGTGQQVTGRCKDCGGSGETRRNRRINVKIPAGVDTGRKIMLRGEGPAGANGGPRGDLILRANVLPHKLFDRADSDIRIEAPVKFTEVALGAEVEVPTIHGPAKLKLPAGTKSGQVLRMRGMGVPKSGGGRGDQLVRVKVTTPQKLSKRQRELLEEFAESWTEDPREELDA